MNSIKTMPEDEFRAIAQLVIDAERELRDGRLGTKTSIQIDNYLKNKPVSHDGDIPFNLEQLQTLKLSAIVIGIYLRCTDQL